jgi:hypothetical protein
MSRYLIIICVACSVMLLLSCSSDSVAPNRMDSVKGLTGASTLAPDSNVALWGYYEISLDTNTWQAEVKPLRGTEYTVDAVSFMQPPSGSSANLKITVTDASKWFTEGLITVDVTLRHPFPGLDQYTGHDVKGVLVSPGSLQGLNDTTVRFSNGIDDCKLLNADGYTRWMNPSEFVPNGTILSFVPGKLGNAQLGQFTATINGYKYFADGIVKDQSVEEYFLDPSRVHERGQFRAGETNTREFQLKFPFNSGPVLTFQYAVVAHWVEPVNLNPNDIPGSFPISANASEAIYMSCVKDESTLWYTSGFGGGGDIILQLEVFDQGGSMNPLGVPGEIGNVIVESPDGLIPGVFATFSGSALSATALPGNTGNSSIVTIEIPDCTPVSDTLANPLLITIESAPPEKFDTGNGNPATDVPLASYFFYNGLKIIGSAPFASPVTDLKLKANRVASGTEVETLELSWTNTNGVEYALYQDADPYDNSGVVNIDYSTPVTVVAGTPAIISTFDHNGGYVFTVRARATAGDPLSESADSNYALIEMDDGGSASDSGNWIMGGNSFYPGQMMMQRGPTYGNGGGYGYFVDNGTYANACMDMWSCLSTPQIPEIPGATVAFIEWAHWYDRCWTGATFPSCTYANNNPGFTGGGATATPPLPTGPSDPSKIWMEYDVFYNQPSDPPDGVGDPATVTGTANPSIDYFFGSPTYSAMWHGTNMTWMMSRVNTHLYDDDIDFAAVTASTHSTLNNWTTNEGHYFMDDLVVIVY